MISGDGNGARGIVSTSFLPLKLCLTVEQTMPRRRKNSESELPLLEADRRSSSSSEADGKLHKSELGPLAAQSDAATQGPISAIRSLFRSRADLHDPDGIATQPSVYDDPNLAEFYRPSPQYENLHRFDPAERWTWAEESGLIRKLDWYESAFQPNPSSMSETFANRCILFGSGKSQPL
jgi:hypothetical protein